MGHLANRGQNLNSVINAIASIGFFLFNKSKYSILDNIKIHSASHVSWLSNETMMRKVGQVVFEKIARQPDRQLIIHRHVSHLLV